EVPGVAFDHGLFLVPMQDRGGGEVRTEVGPQGVPADTGRRSGHRALAKCPPRNGRAPRGRGAGQEKVGPDRPPACHGGSLREAGTRRGRGTAAALVVTAWTVGW